MNIKATLYRQLTLAVLCLSVLSANAQTESMRNKMGELYDCGYTNQWLGRSLANSYIVRIYKSILDKSQKPEDKALNDLQKYQRARLVDSIYEHTRMRGDVLDILIASLPEGCTENVLSNYKIYKETPHTEEFDKTDKKISSLSEDSVICMRMQQTFKEPLTRLAKGKYKKPKRIEVPPCAESYRSAFDNFWAKSEQSFKLTNAIMDENKDALSNLRSKARSQPSLLSKGDIAGSYNSWLKDMEKNHNNVTDFCRNNAPAFWLSIFIEQGITEEELKTLTLPLTCNMDEIRSMEDHLQDNRKTLRNKLLKCFSEWHTAWFNNPDEDHSVLTLIPQLPPEHKDSIQQNPKLDAHPMFPGGETALMNWLKKNIKYPTTCKLKGIQGTVRASFVVDKDGCITECKILQSPDPDMSEEVLRMLSLMPKWDPALLDGRPVRERYSIPVMFRWN